MVQKKLIGGNIIYNYECKKCGYGSERFKEMLTHSKTHLSEKSKKFWGFA